MWVVAFAVLVWMGFTPNAFAECVVSTDTPTYINGKRVDNQCDENGRLKTITDLAGTVAGEDVTNDVQKVESRFSNLPTGATTSKMSSDTAIKNAPGFLKRITCWSDAAATAGNIKLLDSTAAGAGNALLDFDVLAVAYLPFTIEFDVPFSVGLYFDVTTTADLFCQVSYR